MTRQIGDGRPMRVGEDWHGPAWLMVEGADEAQDAQPRERIARSRSGPPAPRFRKKKEEGSWLRA
jgi:hypothetical protein